MPDLGRGRILKAQRAFERKTIGEGVNLFANEVGDGPGRDMKAGSNINRRKNNESAKKGA